MPVGEVENLLVMICFDFTFSGIFLEAEDCHFQNTFIPAIRYIFYGEPRHKRIPLLSGLDKIFLFFQLLTFQQHTASKIVLSFNRDNF